MGLVALPIVPERNSCIDHLIALKLLIAVSVSTDGQFNCACLTFVSAKREFNLERRTWLRITREKNQVIDMLPKSARQDEEKNHWERENSAGRKGKVFHERRSIDRSGRR
jgi:hypothetical protein